MAIVKFGANGTSANKMFDGRCVNTIVLMKPDARCDRHGDQVREAEQMPLQKRIVAAAVTEIWKRW